nr:hypothetical protein [Tanacetum cinerariifolium]
MAPVTPPRATMMVPSTYEVGGPSTAAIEGPSFPLPAPGLLMPPTVIEDLGTRLGNLEYKHRVLTRKMEEIIIENLPPPNDNQNAPEEEPFIDQAPAAFDGFA